MKVHLHSLQSPDGDASAISHTRAHYSTLSADAAAAALSIV